MSDDLYGTGSLYVSKQRLEAMLDREWSELQTQLGHTRGPQTRFFSFADTVSARNYAGTNEPHGWVGLRFQLQPGSAPHDILLHINLRDPTNVLQQEAVGILGVNLIFAAFYQLETKESFLEGLAEDVVRGRVEIDFVEFHGPAFSGWDHQHLLAHLVQAGFAEAVRFSGNGATGPPSEVLHNKAVVLAPGYFGHIDSAYAQIQCKFWLRVFTSFALNWEMPCLRRLGSFASRQLRWIPQRKLQKSPTCCAALMRFSRVVVTCFSSMNVSSTP